MGYNPRKRPEMAEITSFADPARVVYQGSQGIEILPGLGNHGLEPTKISKNGRKHEFCRCLYSRVPGGHRASKSSRDPKIMGYNPRKRPEMAKNTSFTDASRFVYRGAQGIKILPGPENRGV